MVDWRYVVPNFSEVFDPKASDSSRQKINLMGVCYFSRENDLVVSHQVMMHICGVQRVRFIKLFSVTEIHSFIVLLVTFYDSIVLHRIISEAKILLD